ncbi:unnamed protein product [Malus baccata var. baccata]
MIEQKRKDQVMAVRSLIQRLLVYGKERRQENELLDREEQEWQVGASTNQDESIKESCQEELEMAIQMAECIYDLDEPDDLPESLELVKFLCAELDKPPPEVQNPLEVIELGTKEDPRQIQISDLSIDAVAKHKVLSFMDGNSGYNQIKMASEDIHKTAFRCPGHVGAYEYLVMPFGLKNAGATYQRVMNAIFHDLIGHNMEVYIDDIVVKSKTEEQHLIDLRHALTRMRVHKLKMNPKKCAFGVRAGNFLGFLVHQRGVEVDKNKAWAIMESPSPTNKVQLQRLLGKINFLRRFIANLAGKIQPLTPLLRLKDKENFDFQYVSQRAVKGQAIADFLAEYQESRDEIINIPGTLEVTNIWIPPGKEILGKEEWIQQEIRRVAGLWITPWKLYFDGSYTQKTSGAGIVIINPQGIYHYYSFLLDYQGNTNNRAEYEALIIGLEILMDLGAMEVEVFGDSELVINQLNGEFKCRHITMAGYYLAATQLLSYWDYEISVSHVPRGANLEANEMAQLASCMPV